MVLLLVTAVHAAAKPLLAMTTLAMRLCEPCSLSPLRNGGAENCRIGIPVLLSLSASLSAASSCKATQQMAQHNIVRSDLLHALHRQACGVKAAGCAG